MRTIIQLRIIAILLAISCSLNGQVLRNKTEKAQDRGQIRVSKRHLDRDMEELEDFKNKVTEFKLALSEDKIEEAEKLKLSLITDMNREVEQSKRKIVADKSEVKRSKREVTTETRDLAESTRDFERRPGKRADNTLDQRDDRRDLRDDRKDLMDDRADMASQAYRTKTQQAIVASFSSWNFASPSVTSVDDMPQVEQLQRFINTLKYDIEATKAELQEDKIELREDRRELREDRRERIEKKVIGKEFFSILFNLFWCSICYKAIQGIPENHCMVYRSAFSG